MAEKFLHRTDVIPAFQQVRRERVPQAVRGRPLAQARPPAGLADLPRNRSLMQMMSASPACPRVGRKGMRREHPLPPPIGAGRRHLSLERRRQPDLATTLGQLALMKLT